MKVKKRLLLIIILIILFLYSTNHTYIVSADILETNASSQVTSNDNSEKPSQLYAQGACLMDAESGRVLFEKNGEKILPMASTTKIMTLIVILENADLEDVVTVSSNAAKQPDVQLNICTGEQYKLKDLVYSLMLESHNDSAVALAEHIGSKSLGEVITKETTTEQSNKYVAQFAKLMNNKATELGCKDTYFITPNGLDATITEDGLEKTHSTTTEELCKIASYAIKNNDFIEITNTKSHTFSDCTGKRSCTVNNKDRFLDIYEGAIGIKTGFTNKAGYCFVGAVKQGNKTLVSAVLGSGWPPNKNYKWADTKKLMDYGVKNYEYYNFDEFEIDKSKLLPITVENGKTEKIDGIAKIHYKIKSDNNSKSSKEKKTEGILMKKNEKIEIIYKIPKKLEAPVLRDTEIGKVSYLVDGKEWKVDTLVTTETVEKIDLEWCFRQVLNLFLF